MITVNETGTHLIEITAEGYERHVPIDPNNGHYRELQKRLEGWVETLEDGSEIRHEATETLIPYSPPVEDLAIRARAERNARMATCDWTMLPDAPMTTANRDAWIAYRAALRDISLQDGFPTDIQWPIIPGVLAGASA